MRKLILIVIALFIANISFAKYDYILNKNLQNAYKKVTAMRFNEAKVILNKERKANPQNLMVDFIEDYIDFYSLLMNGSTAKFKKLSANKEKRLARFSKGNILSAYHVFVKAETKMHWAIVRAQYGDQLTAFRELRSAYKLLKTNQKQFPNFIANYKSLGILRTIFSAIPDNYKWSAKALGVDGSLESGYRDITKALNYAKTKPFLFEEELRVIYAYILVANQDQHAKAWKIISHPKINTKTSLLACLVKGDIAMRIAKNETAIQIFENAPKTSNFEKVPHIEYYLGLAKLRKLDKSAKTHFNNYLKQKVTDNFVKSTYLRLAWYNTLFSNNTEYNKYINLTKTKGITKLYDDQKSLKLAKIKFHKDILKMQVLYDGGYYTRAAKLIASKNINSFQSKYDKTNYHYLAARVAHKQKQYDKAISNYKKAIKAGEGTTYYFVCYSALQIGELYELKKNKVEARKYYNACLKYKSELNQSSYHQQAKDGLKRVK